MNNPELGNPEQQSTNNEWTNAMADVKPFGEQTQTKYDTDSTKETEHNLEKNKEVFQREVDQATRDLLRSKECLRKMSYGNTDPTEEVFVSDGLTFLKESIAELANACTSPHFESNLRLESNELKSIPQGIKQKVAYEVALVGSMSTLIEQGNEGENVAIEADSAISKYNDQKENVNWSDSKNREYLMTGLQAIVKEAPESLKRRYEKRFGAKNDNNGQINQLFESMDNWNNN